ncbi:MAG TPA: ABC transporter permease, partial [Lacunisphaera sp.]|nr:ABC transporter permease [Lacunisphaera sp.]
MGLGVNTALFTWFNAIAFRPLPVMNPDQLYTLARVGVDGGTRHRMPYPDFIHLREHQTVFSELTAAAGCGVEFGEADQSNPVTGEAPLTRRVDAVATNYFALFGVPMALGRPLVPDDETTTRAQAVIVLSHEFWQRQFNGDPSIVGRTIRVQGLTEETVTVVGVTGAAFYGTRPEALAGWVPMLLRPGQAWRTDGMGRDCVVTGRLRSGVSREQAADELQAIVGTLPTRDRAGSSKPESIALVGASSYIVLTAKQVAQMLPLIALFGVVLVVAGVNASNLILARAVTRQFEFAVRSALGATRRRLFAQIMTEALVLGLLGGVAGWLIAAGLLRFVWPWLLNMVPGAREALAGLNLQADHRVFGFTVAASLLAGAVGGLLPALQATRRNLDSGLKRDGSIFGPRLHLGRVRNLLAIAQLALSAALLFTAGSLVHRALGGEFADVGLDQARLATFQVRIPWKLPPDRVDAARRQAIARIRALPAVAAVSEMPRFPFAAAGTQVVIPGGGDEPARTRAILHLAVPVDYFSTIQLPLIRGRIFTESEIAGDPVVVINEKAAREFWPAGEPVGQRLELPAEIIHTEESSASQAGTTGDRPRI